MKTSCFLGLLLYGMIFCLPLQAQESDSILTEIKQHSLLKVAIREDAVPFGYRDLNNNLSGLCLDLVQFLREELKTQLPKKAIAIKLYRSTLLNRFELVSDGVVHLECGPNTIRPVSEYSIQFSAPFFISGTQFLIKQEMADKFRVNSNLANLNIGVLKNTTSQQLITEKYPQAKLVEFQGPTGRYRGIQALRAARIDAFASDGILLIGEAILQGLALPRNYILVPETPLDCQYYGLILPAGDPQWQSFINSVIKKARSQKLFSRWFNVNLPEIQQTAKFCRDNREQ